MVDLAGRMEVPLHRARGLADALAFVGHGLESMEDDGARPVLTLAGVLADDLDSITRDWQALHDLAARGP
jgi:hypothetical protein